MIKKAILQVQKLIKGGLLHILSGSFFSKVITMLSTILVARLVTKELYAYYSYTTNLYSYVDLINGLEMAGALLVFCSRSDDDSMNRSWFQYSVILSTVAQVMISLGLCVVTSFAAIAYPEARRYIWMYLPIPVFTTIINCLQSVLRAYGANKLFSAIGIVRASVVTVVALILVPFIRIEGLIFSIYLASIITISIGGCFCYKKFKSTKRLPIAKDEKKRFHALAFSFLVASFFSHVMPLNEFFLVNELIADEVVSANFKVAGIIPQQLGLISSGICIYYYPFIAKTKDYLLVWKKIKKIGLCVAMAIVAVSFIGMLSTPLLIGILYGEKYVDAITLSYILWIARMLEYATRVVPITFLPALGDVKYNYIASPIFCLLHIIIDYWLILKLGIGGAAYASIIINCLYGICSWIYLSKYCKNAANNSVPG